MGWPVHGAGAGAVNYYPRNIGDWRVATGKLTRVQRDIYSDLIDTYYDKEQPLTADFDMLAEDHGCRTVEERDALSYVLKRFFKRDGAVWRHERCDEEIAHVYQVINARSKAGKLSGSARALKRAQRKMNNGGTNAEQKPAEGQLPNTEDRRPPSSPDGEEGGEHAAAPPAPTPPPPAPPAPAPAKPEKAAASRPTRKAPKDFSVSPEMAAWAAEKCPLLTIADIERETEMFRNHTFGRAITDWLATWRNWLLKEQKFRESKPQYQKPRLNGPAADRKARGESFMAAVMGEQDAGSREGAIDVESRVIRDGEGHPPE